MKELSIKQKAKDIETVKQMIADGHISQDVAEKYFPELKESEDVLTWLKNYISEEAKCLSMDIRDNDDRITLKKLRDSLVWLEKHSESDETKAKVFLINKGYPIDTNGIFPTYEEMYNIIREGLENQGEQKSTDKVEPKFKVGDWVVKGDVIAQILDVQEQYYVGFDTEGKDFTASRFLSDDRIHLWTIDDAKDGDALVCNEEVLLFKSYSSVQGRISLYCWYNNGHTNNFHSKEVADILMTTRNRICPATKEQRDLLFRRMKEAGYEWDAENKKLRTI